MSIISTLKAIKRMENKLADLQEKYHSNAPAAAEISKLRKTLKQLENYLNNLDHLKPNYNTNEINNNINAIMLHVDILKEELEKNDYKTIERGVRLIKTMLKFHPTKYSSLAFISEWFLEWLYFV